MYRLTLILCELQVLGTGIDHGVAGNLEQGGPLIGDLHLGLDVRHVGGLLVARGRLELRDRPLQGVAVLHNEVITRPQILELGGHHPGNDAASSSLAQYKLQVCSPHGGHELLLADLHRELLLPLVLLV